MRPAGLHPLAAALQIARWEFRRYFKPRQQLIGLAIMITIGGIFFAVMRLSAGSPPPIAQVAVTAPPGIGLPAAGPGVRFTSNTADRLPQLLDALARGEVDGVLQLNADWSGELSVQRERGWIGAVQASLNALRRDAMLERERIPPETVREILAPAPLAVVIRSGDRAVVGPADEPAAGRFSFVIAGMLMMVMIMAAMGTLFASITGEKQIRVTEQVLSAITPQTWMDGKILGVAAVSIASVLFTASGFLLLALALRLAGVGVPMPLALASVATIGWLALFVLLGVFFWLSFLAAVAAIIDDPQTSARGGFLMIPMLASGLAFFAMRDPDSTLVRTLSLLPPTAPTAMPARVILTDVHPLEAVLALVLLAAAALLMRAAAGRIFRTAMLMYGKEPSWREIRRWVLTR